jgi:hypothetical protein
MVNRRNVGHAYERQIMHEMIDLGFTKCKTSRNESRILDATVPIYRITIPCPV